MRAMGQALTAVTQELAMLNHTHVDKVTAQQGLTGEVDITVKARNTQTGEDFTIMFTYKDEELAWGCVL